MFTIHKSTILPMLDIMEDFNRGEAVKDRLSKLLDHEDYQIEIEMYKEHPAGIAFTKEEYLDYFLNIRKLDVDKITSKALRYRVSDLLYILDHIDHYRVMYKAIETMEASIVRDTLKRAKLALPDRIKMDEIRVIFSIGLGVAGGWAYQNTSHYDLRMVLDRKTKQGLKNVIAHESHHIGYRPFLEERLKQCSDDIKLVMRLSEEGLPVKFCNNFEGFLTQRLYPQEEMSLDAKSYAYYQSNFKKIYEIFKDDVMALRAGLKDPDRVFIDHYSYRDIVLDEGIHENYLLQPIKYHLGAEIWGVIFDVYGRSQMLSLMEDPSKFFNYYNGALDAVGLGGLKILQFSKIG